MAQDSDCNASPRTRMRDDRERDCSDPSMPYSTGTLENLVEQLHGISNSSSIQRENEELKKRISKMPYEWAERRAPLEDKINAMRADLRDMEKEIREMQEKVELEKKQYEERNQEYQRFLDEQRRLHAEIKAYNEKSKKIQKQFRLVGRKMGNEIGLIDGMDGIDYGREGNVRCGRLCCSCTDKLLDAFKGLGRLFISIFSCFGIFNKIPGSKTTKGIFSYIPCCSKRAICPLLIVFLLFLLLWYLGIIIFQCKYPFPGGYLPGAGPKMPVVAPLPGAQAPPIPQATGGESVAGKGKEPSGGKGKEVGKPAEAKSAKGPPGKDAKKVPPAKKTPTKKSGPAKKGLKK